MPPRRRAVSPPDQLVEQPRHFTRGKVAELWDELAKPLQGSRERMIEAEDIQLGRIRLVPPKHLTRADGNVKHLVPALAQRKSLVLNMTNLVAEARPIITRRRPPKGGPATESRAEETETALNALLLDLFPWDESAGRAVQHAEYAVVTLLAEDMWDAGPEYNDVLPEEEWRKLSKKEQQTYRKSPEPEDGKRRDTVRYERPKPIYWRDEKGRGIEDDDYGRRSPKETRKAFEDAVRDHYAQHPPFAIRGYSAFDTAHAHDAEGLEVLVVRQLMTESQIIAKGYRGDWLTTQDGKDRLLCPAGFDRRLWGKGNRIYLYHVYCWIDGDPHIAYMVGGRATDRVTDDGEVVEAITNLREKWGFSRLPCAVYYGPHLQTDNRDDMPVPFMDPIGATLLAYEGLLGSRNILAWRRGTAKYVVTPEKHVPVEAYFDAATSTLRTIDLDENADIVTAPGPIGTLAPLEPSGDTRAVGEEFLASIRDATPSSAAFGGGGSDSGREAALLHTYAQTSNGMAREGLRQAYEDAASFILEWACCLMRKRNIPEIPYYANVETEPQEGSDPEGKQVVLVRLREDWIGANYRVTAEYLPTPNPILIQQEADLYDKGLGSFDDVQKARGKTNPLRERIKALNDAYWRSERGMMELAALDARRRADVEKALQLEAALAGLAAPLALGPDGKPTSYGPSAALDPMYAEQGGGGGPTSAQVMLAGTIGGGRAAEMQDLALTAGAPAPAGMAPSGAPAPGMGM